MKTSKIVFIHMDPQEFLIALLSAGVNVKGVVLEIVKKNYPRYAEHMENNVWDIDYEEGEFVINMDGAMLE